MTTTLEDPKAMVLGAPELRPLKSSTVVSLNIMNSESFKSCKICGTILIESENWTSYSKKNYAYRCNSCINLRNRERYQNPKTREKQRASHQRWIKNNPEKYSLSHQVSDRRYYKQRSMDLSIAYQKKRAALFEILGHACVNPYGCHDKPFTDKRALELDHIVDDGAEERNKYRSYHKMITEYVANPNLAREKLQILCANCNRIKRYEHFIQKGTWLAGIYGEEKN